ncbi:hypothetical protein MMC25_002567 [Agyrium rufum]|nr:hypothetical protein [Agyrium rufum]
MSSESQTLADSSKDSSQLLTWEIETLKKDALNYSTSAEKDAKHFARRMIVTDQQIGGKLFSGSSLQADDMSNESTWDLHLTFHCSTNAPAESSDETGEQLAKSQRRYQPAYSANPILTSTQKAPKLSIKFNEVLTDTRESDDGILVLTDHPRAKDSLGEHYKNDHANEDLRSSQDFDDNDFDLADYLQVENAQMQRINGVLSGSLPGALGCDLHGFDDEGLHSEDFVQA